MKKLLIIIGVTIGLNTSIVADEWPKKLWEIDLESEILDVASHPYLKQGFDNNAVVAEVSSTGGLRTAYWISSDGSFYNLNNQWPVRKRGSIAKYIIHLDDDNLIFYYSSTPEGYSVDYLQKKDDEVITAQFTRPNITTRGHRRGSSGSAADINNQGLTTIQISWEGSKITGWDFTPPSSTAPKPDDGNGGGNETVNSRLIIKTDGPDIALATDGKLGAAELQKSNDLQSWRKLGDVPAEAAEVLVTPRKSGNEFYRLKKR
jgi:hypothetical protein